jgi:hypothetical protein
MIGQSRTRPSSVTKHPCCAAAVSPAHIQLIFDGYLAGTHRGFIDHRCTGHSMLSQRNLMIV